MHLLLQRMKFELACTCTCKWSEVHCTSNDGTTTLESSSHVLTSCDYTAPHNRYQVSSIVLLLSHRLYSLLSCLLQQCSVYVTIQLHVCKSVCIGAIPAAIQYLCNVILAHQQWEDVHGEE